MTRTLYFGVGEIMPNLTEIDAQDEKTRFILRGKLDRPLLRRLPVKQIEVLDLSNCQLDDAGVSFLMEKITKEKESLPLQTLNLSGNTIGPKSVGALSKALEKLLHLQSLNLSDTQLNDEETRKILEVLKENNKSLKHLDLSHLKISGKETAKAIIELIRKNPNPLHLELAVPQFSEEDYESMYKEIQARKGEIAGNKLFTPEDSGNSENSAYKKELAVTNPGRFASYVRSPVCANESPQAHNAVGNESREVFSSVVQNC